MELPFNHIQTLRELDDVSIIWYSEKKETEETFKDVITDLQKHDGGVPFYLAKERSCLLETDLVKTLNQCIRTTLIVSDQTGYDLLFDMFNDPCQNDKDDARMSYNYSISDIIIYDDMESKESKEFIVKIEELIKAANKKNSKDPSKKVTVHNAKDDKEFFKKAIEDDYDASKVRQDKFRKNKMMAY